MKDPQLEALIRRYYPLSWQGRLRLQVTDAEAMPYAIGFRWLVSSSVGLATLFFEQKAGFEPKTPVAVLIMLPLTFAAISYHFAVLSSEGKDEGGTNRHFLPADWIKGIVAWIKWPGKLRRLLRNPYQPELILGTVEAIEAELKVEQGKADAIVLQRRESLEAHRDRLTAVSVAINQRLNEGTGDKLLDQSRATEASTTLEQVLRDLAQLDVWHIAVATALAPAKKIADGLRLLYADALEVDAIARAKGVVADRAGQDKVAEVVFRFQREALQAANQLLDISELVGAKVAAEAELDALIGIQPVSDRTESVTVR